MEDNTPRWIIDLDTLLCKNSVWSKDLELEVVDTDTIFPLLIEFIEPLTNKPTSKLSKEPEKEDVTPEPSQQVQNVTQGGSVCNPKKEETPIADEHMAYNEQQALADYKKRLVGGLEELQFSYGSDGNSMLLDAIKLVEETD